MTQYERELSNLSYTSKDFQAIYPELLDLAKKISYKWDPTVSDESDPGVVLLKLAALMADKNNYNIDKNILELFPLSVTQQANARQIFEQCGYSMKHYQSADTTVSLTVVKEPEFDLEVISPNDHDIDLNLIANARVYSLPIFTMVSDIDNNVVYTIVENVVLKSDGVTVHVQALEGVAVDYEINGLRTITASNLDYNNRLYFTELDVAENGIFISNVDSSKQNYSEWEKVDNLVIQPMNTKCYKFGLTDDGSMCYIEFPSDIDSLMGNGINITYIRTSGRDGNIGAKRLVTFYNNVTAEVRLSNDIIHVQELPVSSEHIYITNLIPGTSGKDPETIDEAYNNYQKIKDTFETLVSLRDYTNFIYTNKNVSNGYVCDRTNDIQSSYTVVEGTETSRQGYVVVRTADKEVPTTILKSSLTTDSSPNIENENESEYITVNCVQKKPELEPFDLRVYGLSYVPDPSSSTAQYMKSFMLIRPENEAENQDGLLTEWEWILRDTADIKAIPHNYRNLEKNRIAMIKNKYPIIARIIPQYRVFSEQEKEIQEKVTVALREVLNARMIDFGEEASYELIYDTILNADPRIRAVALDDLTYETYAVYLDDNNTIQELRIDDASTPPGDSSNPDDPLNRLWIEFRNDIYARSILAGTTQFLLPNNEFTYSLQQKDSHIIEDVASITTNTDIILRPVVTEEDVSNEDGTVTTKKCIYEAISEPLESAENVVFTAPNFVTQREYASYVKFVHNIGLVSPTDSDDQPIVVQKNSNYTLKDNEYIVMFWKVENDDSLPYRYAKYSKTSEANIISPSFNLKAQPNPAKGYPKLEALHKILSHLPDGEGSTESLSMVDNLELNDYLLALQGSSFVLTGSNTISTKTRNYLKLTDFTRYMFWTVNNTVEKNGKRISTLFAPGQTSYILQNNEYVMYTNASRTQFVTLGAGTLIERRSDNEGDLKEWSVEELTLESILDSDTTVLDNNWFTIPAETEVVVTEMEYYQVGPGNKIKFTALSGTELPFSSGSESADEYYVINNESVFYRTTGQDQEISLTDVEISYVDSTGSEVKLPLRNTPGVEWKGYSLLNILMSPSSPQILSPHHQFKLYDNKGDDKGTIGYSDTPIYVSSNREVEFVGGKGVNTVTYTVEEDGEDKLQLLNLYHYKRNIESIEMTNVSGNYGAYSLAFIQDKEAVDGRINLEFNVPAGEYIVPVYTDFCKDTEIKFEYTVTSVGEDGITSSLTTTLDDIRQSRAASATTLYVMLKVEDTTAQKHSFSIILNKAENSSAEYVLVDTLYCFKTQFNEDEFNNMRELLSSMDLENRFNYTYVIPEMYIVENPLSSKSFLDTNHVFNPFTICEWAVNDKTLNKLITVINKVK